MPFNLWTNSVLWLTAESPVLDTGATNANWICYAKNCLGNATQNTVASQPLIITTNGVKVLSFDGGDFIVGPVFSPLTAMSVFVSVNLATANAAQTIARNRDGVNDGFSLDYLLSPPRFSFLTDSGTSLSVTSTNTILPNVFYDVCATYDGSMMKIYIDGVFQSETNKTGAIDTSVGPLTIGATVAGTSLMSGSISSLFLFNTALSSNEVWRLSQ
jgi:hypothetical protein